MVDEPSPAEEARLRRLLARSRHDEVVPEDVAEHLDAVLARLESGEDVGGTTAAVHALAAARRRRTVSLLIAAAAVVVVGIGLGQVVDGLGSGGDVAATDSASQEDAAAADRSQGRTDGDDAAGGAADAPELGGLESQQDSLSSTYSADALGAQVALGDLIVVDGRLVEVPQEGFTRAAARVQRQVVPAAGAQGRRAKPLTLSGAAPRVRRDWEGCTPVDYGEGTAVAVLYDGDPAILVFRPANGSSQVVELLQCGTGATQRSVTLPAR